MLLVGTANGGGTGAGTIAGMGTIAGEAAALDTDGIPINAGSGDLRDDRDTMETGSGETGSGAG